MLPTIASTAHLSLSSEVNSPSWTRWQWLLVLVYSSGRFPSFLRPSFLRWLELAAYDGRATRPLTTDADEDAICLKRCANSCIAWTFWHAVISISSCTTAVQISMSVLWIPTPLLVPVFTENGNGTARTVGSLLFACPLETTTSSRSISPRSIDDGSLRRQVRSYTFRCRVAGEWCERSRREHLVVRTASIVILFFLEIKQQLLCVERCRRDGQTVMFVRVMQTVCWAHLCARRYFYLPVDTHNVSCERRLEA